MINKIQGFYYVKTENETHECKLRGILKRKESKNNCVVGDVVEIDSENTIVRIEERKNLLERPIVANIDYFIIQFASRDPNIDFERLNLLLLRSFYYNIKPIILINKIDLLNDEEIKDIQKRLEFLKTIDVEYYMISTKDNIGIDEFKLVLKDKISAFGGPSGVGKSSIINLLQNKMKLIVGETSRKLKRGKHTTKDTNLLPLAEGGYIIDTPGFSSVELPMIKDENALIRLFPEFIGHEHCKFNNCHHLNEPKCEIKELLNEGKYISEVRYDFYKRVYEKLKKERWNKYD